MSESIPERIRLIGSLFNDVLKFSVMLYLLGFFVVNVYLLMFGFMVYDLTSPRYLTAGVLFTVFAATYTLSVAILTRMNLERYYATVYGIVFSSFMLAYIFGIGSIDRSNLTIKWAFYLVLAYPALFLWGWLPLIAKRCADKKWMRILAKIAILVASAEYIVLYCTAPFQGLVAFFLLLWFISWQFPLSRFIELARRLDDIDRFHDLQYVIPGLFGLFVIFGLLVYPSIERIKGGGMPLEARVWLKDDVNKILGQRRPEIDFTRCSIIYENSGSIFVGINRELKGVKERASVEVPRGGVAAIEYVPSGMFKRM